jgi:hypothetical protein
VLCSFRKILPHRRLRRKPLANLGKGQFDFFKSSHWQPKINLTHYCQFGDAAEIRVR